MQKLIVLMIIFLVINFCNISFENTNQINDEIFYVGFSICSDISDVFVPGRSDVQKYFGHHSWLEITNFTNTSIYINSIEILPLETMTIGTWQGSMHNGIFYNVETYYNGKGEFSKKNSAYKSVLLNDFKLNYLISILGKPENDIWTYNDNCSYFAEKIWNEITDVEINSGIIKSPLNLYNYILRNGGKQGFVMSAKKANLYYRGKNPIEFEL